MDIMTVMMAVMKWAVVNEVIYIYSTPIIIVTKVILHDTSTLFIRTYFTIMLSFQMGIV